MIAEVYLDTNFSISVKNIEKIKQQLTNTRAKEFDSNIFSDLVIDNDYVYSFIGENTFVVKGSHIIYVDFHN